MRHKALLAATACLALAATSLLLPSAPTTDPWGWIVWGREVAHLQLRTAIGGAPSWKPLPVLFTTPLSLFGGAAPDLWLLVGRAAGLLGLVAAYRLAWRLAGRSAGVLAAAGLLLSSRWTPTWLHGYAEPAAIAMLLFAVDRHWSGRPRQALLLAAGVALVRPEAFGFVLLYALLLWRRRELPPAGLALLAVSVPVLWIVPDWIGSGHPFHAAEVSRAVDTTPAGVAIAQGLAIAPLPLALAALAGLAVARRIGDRRVVALSALTAAWVALLTLLMLAGYPASARFFVFPAALLCVLGAMGAIRAAGLASLRWSRLRIAAALVAVALPALAIRVARTSCEARASIQRAAFERSLDRAIARAGPARLRACGVPVLPRGLGWIRGDVAWRLGLSPRSVRSVLTTDGSYLRELSRSGTGGPHQGTPREVTFRTRRERFVLLDPFGRMPLRPASSGPDLRTATRAGRWRVLVPSSDSCGRRRPERLRAA